MTSRNASILVDPFQPARPIIGAAHMSRDDATKLVDVIEHEVQPGMPVLLEIATDVACAMLESGCTLGPNEVGHCFGIANFLIDQYNALASAALKQQQQQAAAGGKRAS